MKPQASKILSTASLYACFLLSVIAAASVRGDTATWSQPAIDTWSYTNASSTGTRIFAPSFTGAAYDSASGLFVEGDSLNDPARYGSMVIAFETSDQITPSLAPSRYAIHSATVTAKTAAGGFTYTDQPITPAGLLAEAAGNGLTDQKPIELFGVGFRDGYAGFDLGPNPTGDRFAESNNPYSASDGGYLMYPFVEDPLGQRHDTTNNITGGFSATAPGNQTAPFTAVPWAIGAATLSPGQTVVADTTYDFSIDLALPGVLSYLQESLAEGSVGFSLSSMHLTEQQGLGGGAFPQWYTKESVGLFNEAEAATLTIDFSILPAPGDYNNDGVVGEEDYGSWVAAYGMQAATPGLGADGNRDGVVDAADYTVWRDHYAPSAVAIPEPLSGLLLIGAGCATIACSRTSQDRVGTLRNRPRLCSPGRVLCVGRKECSE